MKPNEKLITIDKNIDLIKQFIKEVIIYQKQTLNRWSQITMQSPAAKIGYVGQHLASLITGICGTRSGAFVSAPLFVFEILIQTQDFVVVSSILQTFIG